MPAATRRVIYRCRDPRRPPKPAPRPNPRLIVPVPLPPLPAFTPRSRVAVVTCAVGDKGRDILSISGPFLRDYAERIGADFRVIEDGGWGAYPLAAKFSIGQFFAAYERLIFLDADILIRPTCPDLFAVVPETHVGIHDDTPPAGRLSRPAFKAKQRRVLRDQGWDVPEEAVPTVLNTGVIVASRGHRSIFEPPEKPFLPSHLYEQDCISLRVLAAGHPIHRLDWTLNYQWWVKQNLDRRADAEVIHFSGLYGDHAERMRLMRAVAAEL